MQHFVPRTPQELKAGPKHWCQAIPDTALMKHSAEYDACTALTCQSQKHKYGLLNQAAVATCGTAVKATQHLQSSWFDIMQILWNQSNQ